MSEIKTLKKKKTDIDLNILLFIFVIGNKFNLILNKPVGVQSESARIRHKKKTTFIYNIYHKDRDRDID